MARVVRVSPLRKISNENKTELRRIFGADGMLVSLLTQDRTPEQLVGDIRNEQPNAVFIDTVPPPHSHAIRALAGEVIVLEPVWKEQPVRDRFDHMTRGRVVVGIGRRDAIGELHSLADGELSES